MKIWEGLKMVGAKSLKTLLGHGRGVIPLRQAMPGRAWRDVCRYCWAFNAFFGAVRL